MFGMKKAFLKRYSHELSFLLYISDLFLIYVSWILATNLTNFYVCRSNTPCVQNFYLPIITAIILATLSFEYFGLYLPWRIKRIQQEHWVLFKSLGISISGAFIIYALIYTEANLIILFSTFFLISNGFLFLSHTLARYFLRYLRKRGFNLRFALIIGAGVIGKKIYWRVKNNSWTGLRVRGFLDDDCEVGHRINGSSVLGRIDELKATIRKENIDQVFIALPMEKYQDVENIMEKLSDELVTVQLIPHLDFMIRNGSVEDFDGLPIITLVGNPMSGISMIFKRLTDIAVSLIGIILTSPVMLVTSMVIKLTSRGPVLYKQERMGFDGELFNMYKFRTMSVGAESETGAVWAVKDDARTTRIGAFLRKTSLDELPQFFNVFKGDMSIVGPRPERPVFIDRFKSEIPKYMWRHKVKTGITGWAQVNGWRGNTSLKKRIDCDLYYIENWSILFDIKIILLTFVRGFVNKNAY